MSLRLYGDLLSQPSRAALLFCRVALPENDRKNFTFKPTQVILRETRTKEYKAMNPWGTVPCLDDNGFFVRESAAIFRYLSRTRNVDDHWYPKDIVQEAKVDAALHWHHLNLRVHMVLYAMEALMKPSMKGVPCDAKKMAKMVKNLSDVLDKLENVWLEGGKKPFVCGDRVSVADLQFCGELDMAPVVGYNLANRPIITAYTDRVRAEFPDEYDQVNAKINAWKARYKGKPLRKHQLALEYIRSKLDWN